MTRLPAQPDPQQQPASGDQSAADIHTLKSLLRWCVDDADATERISVLLEQDGDSETAGLLRRMAIERLRFASRLRELLQDAAAIPARRTLRNRRLRLRLSLAERIPVGYDSQDDRRFVLRLARRWSDQMVGAYRATTNRVLSPLVDREVDRQARAALADNRRIHYITAGAGRR